MSEGSSKRRRIARLMSRALAVGVAAAGRLEAQSGDSPYLRPTTVTVIITNDRLYSGQYSAQGVSRVCGKMDLGFPHRARSFTVEFPDDEPDLKVRSVSFNSDTLPPGSSTGSFYLAVGVRVGERGAPPLYVVRANEPQYNEPGTASLANDKGVTTLAVEGTAALGVQVKVKVVCNPKT